MKETEFKILMHCGDYVDAKLLEKGIYTCSKPFIYWKDETIETMVERSRMMMESYGKNFMSERYLENLSKCQLVSVLIMEVS